MSGFVTGEVVLQDRVCYWRGCVTRGVLQERVY